METEVNFFRSSPSSQPQGDLLHPLSQLLFHFIFHFHFPVASEFDSCSELDFFSSSFFLLHDPSSPRQLHRHTLCGRLLGRSSIDLGVIHNEFSQFKQQLVRPLYSLSFSFFIFYFLFFIFHFFHFFIFFSFLFSFFSQTSAAKLKAALTGQACTRSANWKQGWRLCPPPCVCPEGQPEYQLPHGGQHQEGLCAGHKRRTRTPPSTQRTATPGPRAPASTRRMQSAMTTSAGAPPWTRRPGPTHGSWC